MGNILNENLKGKWEIDNLTSTIQVKQGSITFQVSVHWSHLSDDKNWQSESQKLSDYLFPTSLLNFHLVYFPFLL
jgi:hypothetical protein